MDELINTYHLRNQDPRASPVSKNQATVDPSKRKNKFKDIESADDLAERIRTIEGAQSYRRAMYRDPHNEPSGDTCFSWNPADYLPKRSTFEPIHIEFDKLASERLRRPGTRWDDLSQSIKNRLILEATTPKEFLVDPHSIFMARWDVILFVNLVYIAIFTPYEIGFAEVKTHWDEILSSPSFWINKIIDVFFLFDILLMFSLKAEVEDKNGTHRILRTREAIAGRYLRGTFVLDFLSVIPLDNIFLAIHWAYSSDEPSVKTLRALRLFRVLKLQRLRRISVMLARVEDKITLSYSQLNLVMTVVLLFFVSHLLACCFGLVGNIHLVLDCSKGYPKLGKDWRTTAMPDKSMDRYHNWIKAAYKGPSPDNMCEPFHVYIWALHFSVMTITSIGYGDLSCQRFDEYVVCFFCMLIGGVLWGMTIGNLAAALSSGDKAEEDYRRNYDGLNIVMAQHHLPTELRMRVRLYLRECKGSRRISSQGEFQDVLGTRALGDLITHSKFYPYCREVSYFGKCSHESTIEICKKFTPEFHSPHESFPRYGRLWIIMRGSVMHDKRFLVRGAHFREDFVLDSVKLQLQSDLVAVACAYVQCVKLSKPDLVDVLGDFPLEAKVVRKTSLKIAFQSAVRFYLGIFKTFRDDEEMRECFGDSHLMAKLDFDSSDALRAPDSKYLRDREIQQAYEMNADCSLRDLDTSTMREAGLTGDCKLKFDLNMKNGGDYAVAAKEELQERLQTTSERDLRMKLRHLQVDLDIAREQIKIRKGLIESRRIKTVELEEEKNAALRKLEKLGHERSHLLVDVAAAQVHEA
jgi:hypothetical protein